MKKILASIASILLSVGFVFSQSSEIDDIVNRISENLKDVSTSKETYEQTISIVSPAVVKYKLIEEGKNTDVYEYIFNLGDIDSYTVKTETSRDVIYVNFSIEKEQDLIEVRENGEQENYENEVSIVAQDIDNARELVDLIKSSIKPSKTLMEQRLSLKTYEERVSWLTSNVENVQVGDDAYKQTLTKGEYPGMFILKQDEVDSRGTETNEFSFNWADIDPATVKFDISGDELAIEFETVRDQKVIRHFQDGEAQSFEDELKIFSTTVEKARDVKQVVLRAIEGAKELVEQDLNEFSSSNEALKGIDNNLVVVNYGDEKITQTREGDCISSISVETTDSKGSELNKFEFNFMDINDQSLEFDVRFKEMFIEVVANKKIKLIKEYEEEAFEGYVDDFDVYVPNVEIARRLQFAFRESIKWCEKEYQKPYSNTETIQWLVNNINDVEKQDLTYEQSLEQVDPDNPYKLKYTKREIDDKGGDEEIFEFNLSDLSLQSVEFDISGDDLEIVVESLYGEKVIKYYKNGEIGNYEDELSFIFNDINKARGIKMALKELIDEATKE